MKKFTVGGAAGMMGQEVLKIMAERGLTPKEVVALDANVKKGQTVSFGEDDVLPLLDVASFDFSESLLCINASPSKDFIPKAQKAGCCVIDTSAAFRLDPDVPLVVAGVNDEDWRGKGLAAVPSPQAIMLANVLFPLHRQATVRRVVVTSFRAVCDKGRAGMDELFRQTRAVYVNDAMEHEVFHKQIAFNVIPQAGDFMDDGFTKDEWQLGAEIKKIVAPEIKVTATMAYVPMFIGEGMAVNIEFEDEIDAKQARKILKETHGVTVVDHKHEDGFVTPIECLGEEDIFVSRIREDSTADSGLCLWVAMDSLRGGAVNVVKIAESFS